MGIWEELGCEGSTHRYKPAVTLMFLCITREHSVHAEEASEDAASFRMVQVGVVEVAHSCAPPCPSSFSSEFTLGLAYEPR